MSTVLSEKMRFLSPTIQNVVLRRFVLRLVAVVCIGLIIVGTLPVWPQYSAEFVIGGAVGLIVGFLLSERWRKQAEYENSRLHEVATTDPLTRLGNRRLLDAELYRRLAIFRRYNSTFSLIMIDVDNFKSINDTRGHDIGDRVLQALSRTIGSTLRDIDLLFRLGGEELVAILPDTSLNNASIVAFRIQKSVEAMVVADQDRLLRVTVSQGIAEIERGEDTDTLLKRADVALYAAKHGGRNTFYFHLGGGCSEPVSAELMSLSSEAVTLAKPNSVESFCD